MRRALSLILAMSFAVSFILSCKDGPVTGPQQIYYGEDVCARCKMIISEEGFSSQFTLPGGEVRKFDDLGCMIHYVSHGEPGEVERNEIKSYYVRDYSSGEWIDGASAYYVGSKNITTPMGYGIIAFGDIGSANQHAEKENGTMLGGFQDAESALRE